MHTPVLAMPNFNKQFIMETDASGTGLGAVLIQEGHSIAYYSQVLGVRNRLKSIYEKELMAIVLAVRRWRHYLLGRHFIIRTDQRSLRFRMEQREVGPEYQKWMYKTLGFDFEIQYKPGSANNAADALSRATPVEAELQSLKSSWSVPMNELEAKLANDSFIQQIISDITAGERAHAGYSSENGKLWYKGRMVIPQKSKFV